MGRIKRGYSGTQSQQTSREARGKGETTGNIGKGHYTRGGGKHLIRDKRTGKSGAVRKITSLSELNRIITEYEQKIKGKIAKTPGAGSALRAGFVTSGGGGAGRK
jgi:hypothetical protein